MRDFIKKNDIDIFLIQETKLIKSDKTPKIPGYTIERKDRVQPKGKEKDRGGGLISGVRKTIPYKSIDKFNVRGVKDHITEALTIEIPTKDKQKVRITNIYVPPCNSGTIQREGGSGRSDSVRGDSSNRRRVNSTNADAGRAASGSRPSSSTRSGSYSRGRSSTREGVNTRKRGRERSTEENTHREKEDSRKEIGFDMSRWPAKQFDMICGDMNAHSLLWDDSVVGNSSDKRGRLIENWAADNNMLTANDGSYTHTSRSSGSQTAPDVTLTHASMVDKLSWEKANGLGSDHSPIVITYRDHIPTVNNKPTFKWKLKEADWTSYKREVERNIPRHYKRKNLRKIEERLRKTILKAANKHIGKKKVTDDNKCYMSKEVKEEIKKRNQLRTTVKDNRQEWIESCRKVAKMIKEEKERKWKEYVGELNRTSDARKIFQTARAIDGKILPRKDNEVLEVNGVAYISDKDKAEQFAKTYRSFSKLPARKRDRRIKRKIWKEHKVKRELEESEGDITMKEMLRAIRETSNGKAAGRDDIPYELVKNLGPLAQEMLLDLYNKCWRGGGIPSTWRTAIIKTMLKEDKDPKDPISYRPISLTACLGKILEKIIANRLIYILEDRGLLTDNQAGFRPGRSTVDQVLKLVQDASDNIHTQPRGRRTMVTFFDYNKAYDMVWRDGLIYKMIQLKLPFRYIRYVRHFLSGRKTTVSINNVHSKEFLLRNGLPQGSSISPLLFLIFINDIDVDIDLETAASLFADDTSAWRADGKIRGSQRILMQEEVDKILAWADEWKMKVNGSKTKAMIISSSVDDQQWDPQLKTGETPIKLVQDYPFLGINIPADLRFGSHVEKIITRCRKRNRVLKCMATKNWGNSLETQRTIYLQYVRPALEYISPSWSPWISESRENSLQRVQNDALRAIAGLTATCPVDFLHLETNIEPLKLRFKKNCVLLRERYRRLKSSDPRRRMLEKQTTLRLKTRMGWRHSVQSEQALEYKTEELKPPLAPWKETGLHFKEIQLEKKKSEYSTEELRRLTEESVKDINTDVIIYTDGSTDGNQNRGGAGVYIQNRTTQEEVKLSFAAGAICSSYGAEGVALLRALEWLEENQVRTATICTDSMSVHKALANDDWKNAQDWTRKIKEKCHQLKTDTSILWIPSHCGCEGNEIADRLADEGTKLDQAEIPITHAIAQARVRKRKWEVKHDRAKETYGERKKPKMEIEKSWPRAVRTLYARLRSGHCKELKHYQYMIEVADDPFCECGEVDTIHHVLCECPILDSIRRSKIGEPMRLSHLVTQPEECRTILAQRFKGLRTNEIHC